MILLEERQALVILGGWNPSIFTPEWVSKYLFDGESVKIEFAVNFNAPQRISNENIRLIVENNKLNLIPITISDDNYGTIENLAVKLADYLPHTPVTAFGINFNYEEDIEKINPEFISQLNSELSQTISGKINHTNIKRSINFADYILNFEIIYSESKIHFNFNYHFNIQQISSIKEKIENNGILKLKEESFSLIQDLNNI